MKKRLLSILLVLSLMLALGILNGAEIDGTVWLLPQGQATRAEVATLLEGFCASLA